MKLLVLGATGGTGTQLVQQAVKRGHSVTALVRAPDSLTALRDSITVRTGNLLDPSVMKEALKGQDAVLSGFGPRVPIQKSDAHLLETFAVVLTRAMVESNVQRLVVISTAFLFRDSIIPPTHLVGRLFFPEVVTDSEAMEKCISKSGLRWTILRPPQLTDGPLTRRYRIRQDHLPRFGFKISRADVADAFLNTVEDDTTVQRLFGLSN